MLRMLHLADLHLGYKPSFLDEPRAAARQKERDQLLENAVNFALDPAQEIDMVLIVGDLFETHRPEKKLVRSVIEQLQRLEASGVCCVTVPGNHDEISYFDSVYRLNKEKWPGILVQNPMPALVARREIKGQAVWIYSLAYTGGLTKVSSLGSFPREPEEGLHIGAFHGTLDWNPGERSLPLKSTDLVKAGYNYIALGHLHRYQEQKIGEALAVYPGAVENKSLGERGVGHFTVVNFQQGKVLIEKPEVAVRKHEQVELDLSTLYSPEEIVAECRRYRDPEKIVEIRFKGTPRFAVDIERVREELQEDFLYLQLADDSSFIDWPQIEKYSGEHTVRGAFAQRILERMKEAEEEREKEVLKLALLKGLAVFQRGE
ncbi:MAG: metallophosphoesterase family protein [Dethiobacteria bacterium]|jgi:exonuclease SbcD